MAQLKKQNIIIADWLIKLTNENKTWGFKLGALNFAFYTCAMSKATLGTINVFIAFIKSLNLTFALNQTNVLSENNLNRLLCRQLKMNHGQWTLCMIN